MKAIIPAYLARLQSSSAGNLTPVGEAMWLMNKTLVLGVTFFQINSMNSSYEGAGKGISASTHTAPLDTACSIQALLHAPYSWFVASISSPGFNNPFFEKA